MSPANFSETIVYPLWYSRHYPHVLCTNFGRGVNLFNSALLCRVVDFKGAQLEFYRILIGVHAKVLLDPKDLKP